MWNWPNCRLEVWINQRISVLPIDFLRVDCTEVAVIEIDFDSRQTIGIPNRSNFLSFFVHCQKCSTHCLHTIWGAHAYLDHLALL